MANEVWVRDYFQRWTKKTSQSENDKSFYTILRNINPETLVANQFDIDNQTPESEEETSLLDLWKVWNKILSGDTLMGFREMKGIAKEIRHRTEPFIMLGTAHMLKGNRKDAVTHLKRAAKMDPNDQKTHLLLNRIGERKDPVLSFLDRENVVNVWLGKLRHKLVA